MFLERCTDQASASLDAFYERAAAGDSDGAFQSGQVMLDLINRLRALDDHRRAWGLTSHLHLCLLAQDSYKSPWYVRFIADRNYYSVEYLMPAAVAPWPNAYVRGEARSADEAVQMILTAMDRCGGWSSEVPR